MHLANHVICNMHSNLDNIVLNVSEILNTLYKSTGLLIRYAVHILHNVKII